MQDKEAMCKRYKRDLDRALIKNKALEKEKRDLEEHLLLGVLPSINSSAARQDSVDSSPELREHKRPKIDKRRQPEQGSSGGGTTSAFTLSKTTIGMTTAYTLSAKDAFNLATVTKNPSSIVDKESALTNQAKATWKTKLRTAHQLPASGA